MGGNKYLLTVAWAFIAIFTLLFNAQAQQATQAYAEVAKKHNLDMAQMALAFVNSRSFVTANIIGATTIEQLASNIASVDLVLSQDGIGWYRCGADLTPEPCTLNPVT